MYIIWIIQDEVKGEQMKPTERFSDRVSDYLKYRPSYPAEILKTLSQECGLNTNSTIADIGSGTGKLTQLLLTKNYPVIGVEPNKEMREAAEAILEGYDKFVSVAGESANTKLEKDSVDLIVSAQAFHWFEPVSTKKEFVRILKPEGRIALIWNQRDTSSPFQKAYDQMLATHCEGYATLNHRNISDDDIYAFLSPKSFELFTYPYLQKFDMTSLLGRMYSSSYTPKQGTPEENELTDVAKQLFTQYETDGIVEFAYETNLYLSD